MKSKIPMIIIILNLVINGSSKIYESTTQEQTFRYISLALGVTAIAIGLGLITRKKAFIISALVITWFPLLVMPFAMVTFFIELQFASVIVYVFLIPFLVWQFSVLRRELKKSIGIGLPIAEEPSHTTTHTDP